MKMRFAEEKKRLEDFILRNLDGVLKQPHSFIRYPFIDPGSVYDGNVWDWDTYWSVYGLLGMKDVLSPEQLDRVIEHAKGNVHNFFDHQLEDGYIPMMIEVADWPEPYLNMMRKQGVHMNMHKPFLCSQIALISRFTGDWSWAEGYIENLERYFACYDREFFNENCGLYVWIDDIMIGMDNDPASFGRPKSSTANIYLNSFMVCELQCMVDLLNIFKRYDRASVYHEKRRRLIDAIQSECWDRRDRFFYSVDVDVCTRKFDWFHQGLGVFWKTLPIKIRAWSGFIPMYAGFATRDQAEALVKHMFDPETFESDFGITTLAKDEKMFDLSATNNPSNWLGPIWLVANYVAFRALMNYGYRREAELLCQRTVRLLDADLRTTGSLHEYYDPFTGKPIMNGGFINWNILVLNMLRELEESDAAD